LHSPTHPPTHPKGGTDSSNYRNITRNEAALRFVPRTMSAADALRAHGTNERLALTDLRGALCTTKLAMQLLGGGGSVSGGGGAAAARAGARREGAKWGSAVGISVA